ncbi:MAG: DUF1501 domain-containing protein [Gemmataceae bacterium]|nr:DUF1501 domain-containing protein [Gemmataceae bacterium]
MIQRMCDGYSRRDMIRMGAASLFGASVTLPALLAAKAHAMPEGNPTRPERDVSLIFLFLHGGLSTIDTFDMKPDAPAEIRGEFRSIATNLPGVQVCEHLPRVAQQMDKFSQIRSFRHHNSDHGPADHYMLTGYFPQAGFSPTLSPNNQRPSHGSVISRKLGSKGGVPPYVCLPKVHPSAGAAYLGSTAAPFTIDADPNDPNFAVADIVPPPAISADRLENRTQLLAQVDRFRRTAEGRVNAHARAVGDYQREAFNLMASPAARQAFDIHAEPQRLRDEYGRNSLGQSCLMARRLVEAGVRCVTIDHSNWDTHDNNFASLRRELLPSFDGGVSTLFRDLADRGILDRTLVVITGEFGRTPRINKNAGRDHWGPAFTVLLGGGGIKGGRVLGASDRRAERPVDNPYGPEDLAATMYQLMGIDLRSEFVTADGRPMPIVNNGRVIRDLL